MTKVRGSILPQPFAARSPVSLPMMKLIQSDESFRNILAGIVARLDGGAGAIDAPSFDAAFSELLETAPGRYARERIMDVYFNADETGNIYDSGKVVCGGSSGAWEVIYSRHAQEASFLTTVPQRALVRCIDGEGECSLRRYKVIGNISTTAGAADWRLDFIGEQAIGPGSIFAFDAPDEAVAFVGRSAGFAFARLVGPVTSPLTHSFHADTLTHAYTSYADEIMTGHSFYLDLLKRLVGDGVLDHVAPENRVSLGSFLQETGRDGVYPAKTKWNIAQILSRLDEDKARALIVDYAASPDPTLAAMARRFA